MGMSKTRIAQFKLGQVVRHRLFPFRGVVFDIDPEFNNTEEWYQSIPEKVRPRKDQPFYHLFAENAESEYIAYVSEQNSAAGHLGRAGAPPAGRRGVREGPRRRLPAARLVVELRFGAALQRTPELGVSNRGRRGLLQSGDVAFLFARLPMRISTDQWQHSCS